MNIWITGASSGLGMYTAQELARRGHTVIAGARSFGEDIKDHIHRIHLDVTDDASVAAFAKKALMVTDKVDVLICCAAVLTLAPCEETDVKEYARVMDVNFLGVVRMVQQVLPLMRKQHSGKIVCFSSINGLLGIPYQSAYTASKHAIEGWAECLQLEEKPFGIQVCLVEPGDHRGGSQSTRYRHVNPASPYQHDWEETVRVIDHDEATGSDPEVLARKVASALEKEKMPSRLCIAKADQHLAVALHSTMPGALQAILRKYYIRK